MKNHFRYMSSLRKKKDACLMKKYFSPLKKFLEILIDNESLQKNPTLSKLIEEVVRTQTFVGIY